MYFRMIKEPEDMTKVVRAEKFSASLPFPEGVKHEPHDNQHYIDQKHGPDFIKEGDWILTYPDGKKSVWKPAEFTADYELASPSEETLEPVVPPAEAAVETTPLELKPEHTEEPAAPTEAPAPTVEG